MSAVRVGGQQENGWLGFDLAEVLAAIGNWDHLSWVLWAVEFNCDVTAVWSDGAAAQEQSDQPSGLPITPAEMRTLAATCRQIIEGRFTGFGPQGSPVLSIEVIRSSYWIVWAEDPPVLDGVRAAFRGVTDYDEPRPDDRPPEPIADSAEPDGRLDVP